MLFPANLLASTELSDSNYVEHIDLALNIIYFFVDSNHSSSLSRVKNVNVYEVKSWNT